MATIAELQTKLTIDNTGFKRGLNDAQKSVEGFSTKAKLGLAAVAAIITTGVVGAVNFLSNTMNEAQESMSRLVDTSTRLGVGIPELQRLQYAAQQSGIGVESLNNALGKMLKNSAAAASGSGPAEDALKRLGINAQEFVSLGVDKQYLKISEALKGIPSPAEQALIATQLFGKGGIEQLSLLKENVGGLLKEFKGLGLEVTTKQAKSLESYGDSVSKLGSVWAGFKNQLAAALAGPFKKILDWIIATSVEMGGLGVVAKNVASFVLSAADNMVGFFGAIYRGIQATIIGAEELLILLLRISQLGTLGLSNLNLPGGLGGAGEKIASLRQDVNQRSAKYIDSQNTQQKIQVEIRAASGFVAEVVNSTENTEKINNTVNSTIGEAARGEQR